jgi:hypothetical protein
MNSDTKCISKNSRATLESMSLALVPLVKLFLRAGLGAGDFAFASKLAFVRAAADNAKLGARLNVSAIAASTGLTRKDVRSLIDLAGDPTHMPRRDSARQRTARVVQGWQIDPAFQDREGNPIALSMQGGERSFAALVRRYAGDVTTMSIFRELHRAGAVSRTRAGVVRLLKHSVRSRGYSAETLADVMGRIRDMSTTLVDNLDKPQRPTFSGFQDLGSVPANIATLFSAVFTERAASLLDGVDRWAASQKAMDKKRTSKSTQSIRRVGIGIYLTDRPGGREPVTLPSRPRRRAASKDAS